MVLYSSGGFMKGIEHSLEQIDQQMAQLYEKRLDVVARQLDQRKKQGLPPVDRQWEDRMIEQYVNGISNPEYKDSYRDFITYIIEDAHMHQQRLLNHEVVAYAGVKGAFAHMAAQNLYPGSPNLNCKSFDEVFEAVLTNKAHYGVIPFENSNSGLVGEVLDGLLKYPVYILHMADQRIKQCLLGTRHATLKDIEYVYSKDQALSQSQAFLKQLNVQTIAYPNTALAARYVADENDIHKAAIAAKENARLYGLKVLAENIQPDNRNTTRFMVIGRQPSRQGNHFSIVFTAKHTSGSLAKIIEVIAKYGLNMDSIQSRPRKDKPFEYFFYIEMDGDLNEENTVQCMEEVAKVCESFRILGKYNIDEYKEEEQ